MLGLRLLQRRRENKPINPKFLAWVTVSILVIFLFIRFFDWIDEAPRSLLPPAVTVLDDVSAINAIVPLPTETFGAELYTVGIYQITTGEIPEGTVAVVYTKDDGRFVEIDYLPGITSTQYLATHLYPTQEVTLDQEREVWIQTVDNHPRCIDYEDDLPNRCEISRHLIADLGERLLLIAADGDHATDGELIEMAKSIMFPVDAKNGE